MEVYGREKDKNSFFDRVYPSKRTKGGGKESLPAFRKSASPSENAIYPKKNLKKINTLYYDKILKTFGGNMFKKLTFFLVAILGTSLCYGEAFRVEDKFYIDAESFNANTEGDEFYIHIGHNIWLTAHSIHKDKTGMFAYESSLRRNMNGPKMEYERKWKCPYCHMYWPIGKPCGNKDCPSKYK